MGQVNGSYERSIGIYYQLQNANLNGLSSQDKTIVSVALDNFLKSKQKAISESEYNRIYEVLQNSGDKEPKVGFFHGILNRISDFFHTRLSNRSLAEKQKEVDEKIDDLASRLRRISSHHDSLTSKLEDLKSKHDSIDTKKDAYLVMSRELGNTPRGLEILQQIKTKIKEDSDATPSDRLIYFIETFDESSIDQVTRYIGNLITGIEKEREVVLKDKKDIEEKLKVLEAERSQIEAKVDPIKQYRLYTLSKGRYDAETKIKVCNQMIEDFKDLISPPWSSVDLLKIQSAYQALRKDVSGSKPESKSEYEMMEKILNQLFSQKKSFDSVFNMINELERIKGESQRYLESVPRRIQVVKQFFADNA